MIFGTGSFGSCVSLSSSRLTSLELEGAIMTKPTIWGKSTKES